MTVHIAVDASAATIRLAKLAPDVRKAADDAVATGMAKLAEIVRGKASDVLNVRSGDLVRSIGSDTGNGEGRVFSDVDYAHIQEYGGRIDIPETVPVEAKALAFEYEGRLVFAKRARAHTVTIPAHSFLRASLAEFAPQFASDLEAAAAGALA